MRRFIVRRVLLSVIVVLGAVFLVTAVLHFTPGDPARAMLGQQASPEALAAARKALGVDDPLWAKYLNYLRQVLTGDWGMSYRSRRPVLDEIAVTLGPTLVLSAASLTVALLIGIPSGVLSATRRNSWVDMVVTSLAMTGLSLPVFVTGLVLNYFLAFRLGWFPISGYDGIRSLVLPALTLGFWVASSLARYTRAQMLAVLREDYIRTARAKGLGERAVIYRHALKNSLLPVVTVVGMQLGLLLGGSIVTETVFAWPGMGRLMVDAITNRDIFLVRGIVLVYALGIAYVNLVVDLLYAWVNPRIRFD